jgi:hypothetical protein
MLLTCTEPPSAQPPPPPIPTSTTTPLNLPRPPTNALAITNASHHLALLSTQPFPRRAVRRDAARPTERPSGCLVVREQKHGWASQHAVARRGGLGGPTPAVLSSPCPRRCPVRASSVPRVAVQLIGVGVRWGCLSVQVSSVRPQASGVASGVRAFSVRCVRPEWSWSVAAGQAVVRLGWDGRAAWSPAVSTTARRLPEVGPWRSRLAQAVLGQRWVGFDLIVVMTMVEQWPHRPHGRPGEARWARIARRSAAGGDHAAWSLCEALGRVAWSRRAFPAAL